jgi:post-segregation antitoxin (ccd killing protein)
MARNASEKEAPRRQNLTISISPETLRKARVLAARRSTSISGLLAQEIERLVGEEEAWLRAERSALALLEQGFPMGGRITATRDEWHER